MEDNLRTKFSSAFSDPSATEVCRNELTRTNSDASALTAETSKHISHQNATASPCTEWTNEKHNLYLDSLEASFVNQLHHSMGLLTWSSDKKTADLNSFQQLPTNTCDSSGPFLVQRDGCWQRVNFRSNQPLLDNAADSHINIDSPWVRRFKRTGKGRTMVPGNLQYRSTPCSETMPPRGKKALSQRLATSQGQLPVGHRYHQDSVGSIIEGSGQNFVDENTEEKSCSLSYIKRLKKVAADASSKDHIVQSDEKFHRREILAVSYASTEKVGEVCNEQLPEKLESFVCPESDVKSFLRES